MGKSHVRRLLLAAFTCYAASYPSRVGGSYQMTTMPGLPTRPCIYDIDLNLETEEVQGLF